MKRSFEERLAHSTARRAELETKIDCAIKKLSNSSDETRRLAARQLILGVFDQAVLQNNLVDTGHPIGADVWTHFETVADLSNQLADLIASKPGLEFQILGDQLDGRSPVLLARELADAAARANLDFARDSIPERAELKRFVAQASIEAYILLFNKLPSASNNPITNRRQSKFISFLNDIVQALQIPLRGEAGSLAQEEIKVYKARQNSGQ